MEETSAIAAIAQIIQLAVAPVFLLAGIAGFLNVLTTRLGRIVDRARVIERQANNIHQQDKKALIQDEASSLWRRISLINWAIRLCVWSALMVCIVIVTLFTGNVITLNLSLLIELEFVTAMLLLITGLVTFLFEVSQSTRHMRAGMEFSIDDHKPPGS